MQDSQKYVQDFKKEMSKLYVTTVWTNFSFQGTPKFDQKNEKYYRSHFDGHFRHLCHAIGHAYLCNYFPLPLQHRIYEFLCLHSVITHLAMHNQWKALHTLMQNDEIRVLSYGVT